MSERSVVKKTYLTEAEASQLSEWSSETGKSESQLLREAVREYLDRDRGARVEERLNRIEDQLATLTHTLGDDDAHTHKAKTGMKTASKATERAREIVRRLQSNHDVAMKNADVERAIEDIAGADDRTIRKYKELFRKRGLLFEHPGDTGIWTLETDDWLDWLKDYAQLNGIEAAEEVANSYPVRVDATPDGYYIELAEEIEQ